MHDNYTVNSFQIPNVVVDEIMNKISPNALKCYLIIIRKTTGWGKLWDMISTSQLMLLSGIKKKLTVYKATEELENLGLILCQKKRGMLTKYSVVSCPVIEQEIEEVVPKKVSTLKAVVPKKVSTFKVVTKKDTSTHKGTEVVPKKDTNGSSQKGYPSKQTNTKETITKEKENKEKDYGIKNQIIKKISEYSNLNKSAVEKWLEFKNFQKITGVTATLDFLNKYDLKTQEEMVDNSLMSKWQRLYAPNQKYTATSKELTQNNHQDPLELYRNYRIQGLDKNVSELKVLTQIPMSFQAQDTFKKAVMDAELKILCGVSNV